MQWLNDIACTLDLDCRLEVHVAQGRVSRELPVFFVVVAPICSSSANRAPFSEA